MGGRIHPSVLSGYGLVEAPFAETASQFGTYRRGNQSEARVIAPSATAAEALEFLGVRTHPATRLVLVALGTWTAVLTNARNGSDFIDHQFWAGRTTGARSVRVVDRDARWWEAGTKKERLCWEARVFDLHAADDSVIRMISCMDDGGRWEFVTAGDPFPAEATFDYGAPKKRDRFTSQNLRGLLDALGPGPMTEDRFFAAPQHALVYERIGDNAWRERVEAAACSLDEADDPAFHYFERAMSFGPHLETHAASIVHDLERAIEINPAYEPRARNVLAKARRIASR